LLRRIGNDSKEYVCCREYYEFFYEKRTGYILKLKCYFYLKNVGGVWVGGLPTPQVFNINLQLIMSPYNKYLLKNFVVQH